METENLIDCTGDACTGDYVFFQKLEKLGLQHITVFDSIKVPGFNVKETAQIPAGGVTVMLKIVPMRLGS